jgi:dihydroorotate dehydrogenase (NAD+) catalytic subunit
MKNKRLQITLGKLKLNNPIIAASGTFGYGYEVEELIDVTKFGGVTTKTITLNPRSGNDTPRLLETPSGLLNSIGLQNPGLKKFIEEVLPKWNKIKNTKLIVSVGGDDINEYIEICKKLNNYKRIDAFELNISCPNVKKGCLAIGGNKDLVEKLIKQTKSVTNKPIIVKLSPNFFNLIEIAVLCEKSGADMISLVNTFLGMAIDIQTRKPYFKNIVAGLSGPAIRPMALKLVYDVRREISIPIIGMGGVTNYKDVLEFLIAGANAVSIGTINFINPKSINEIIAGLDIYLKENNIPNVKSLYDNKK